MTAAEERIVDPVTGGEKGRKAERYDLFPFDATDELARVYAFGAKKYSDHNWLRGYAWSLSLGALMRHVSRFAQGENRDPETGCLHLAHAAWHCFTLIVFHIRGLGTDDRMPGPVSRPRPLDAAEPIRAPSPTPLDVDVVNAIRALVYLPPLDTVEIEDDPEADEPVPYVPTSGAV